MDSEHMFGVLFLVNEVQWTNIQVGLPIYKCVSTLVSMSEGCEYNKVYL